MTRPGGCSRKAPIRQTPSKPGAAGFVDDGQDRRMREVDGGIQIHRSVSGAAQRCWNSPRDGQNGGTRALRTNQMIA
jgi:hypothetical protein